MNRPLIFISILLVGVAFGVRTAYAEPAWGSNCLSCHNQIGPAHIYVLGEDSIADPQENGAPDRGVLKVFWGSIITGTAILQAEVSGLDEGDTYAIQVKRFRLPGVTSGGALNYGSDCVWTQWEETANHFTDPYIAHTWPAGPHLFEYDMSVSFDSDMDFYDLVFAVAGKKHDTGELFYAEEHFYLRVDFSFPEVTPGDLDQDGDVDQADYTAFAACLGGVDDPLPPASCHFAAFGFFDLDDDADVDLMDFAIFTRNYSE